MLKKLKAIKNHVIFKDTVFLFFGIDMYKGVKAGKEVIPLNPRYYGTALLIIHSIHNFYYTIFLWCYVMVHVLPPYFLFEFWKKDLWIILWEIALAFWLLRLPFTVTWGNFLDAALYFHYWLDILNNKKEAPKRFWKRRRRIFKKYRFIKKMHIKSFKVKFKIFDSLQKWECWRF